MNKETTKKFIALPLTAGIFLGALFIRNAELAVLFVKQGIENCFLTVIPSLFPLMVVAEIINECNVLPFVGRMLGGISSKFGLSPSALAAVLLGLLLGFPMGTRALIALYDRGEITSDELNHALGFCGMPSFAFIVNAVGSSLFGQRSFGLALYFSAFLSAIVSGLVFSKRKKTQPIAAVAKSSVYNKRSAEIITSAISASTKSVILLCGYVVFFSAVVGCASNLFELSATGGAATGVLLELSSGALACASVGKMTGILLCGFVIGWSGLSVNFQIISICEGCGLSFKKYFIYKIAQGIIGGLLAFVVFSFRI